MGEVGVSDGAEAYDFCDVLAGRFIEEGVFVGNDIEGAVDGFLEEVFKFYGVTGACFDGFAVFAEDGAEPGVSEFGYFVAFCGEPFLDGSEEVFEVVLLAAVGDVDNFVDFGDFDVVEDGSEVG